MVIISITSGLSLRQARLDPSTSEIHDPKTELGWLGEDFQVSVTRTSLFNY